MKDHPTSAELRELASRTLEALDREQALIEHLGACDECFVVYESLWVEASADLPDLAGVFLDSADAARLEYRVFRRIHVASLGSESSWLATEGFLRAVLGVLLPIVDFERARAPRARGEES